MWGYGYGWGRRHGWGGHWGRGGWWRGAWIPAAPKGYTYVGPCRCGFGPHAYYVDEKGKLVHASQIFGFSYPFAGSELEVLKSEKAALEERLRELEGRIKELERKED